MRHAARSDSRPRAERSEEDGAARAGAWKWCGRNARGVTAESRGGIVLWWTQTVIT